MVLGHAAIFGVAHEADDGTCLLYIDRHLVHEVTSPQAFEGLRMTGRKVRAPEKTIAVPDHNVPTTLDRANAATMTEDEMRDWIGVDSLKFISLDGLYRAAGEAAGRDPKAPKYCDACFSGEYPVAPSDMIEKGFELKAAE